MIPLLVLQEKMICEVLLTMMVHHIDDGISACEKVQGFNKHLTPF